MEAIVKAFLHPTPKQLKIVAASLLLLAVVVGANMYQLYTEEQLWGYRPLVFLLAAWLAWGIGKQAWRSQRGDEHAWRDFLLATLSGLLLGVGFPDILPLPFLLFVAWIPLLLVEQRWRNNPAVGKRRMRAYAFHTLMVWNIVATYWVMNTSFAAGLVANFANCGLMLIPWGLYLWTYQRMPKVSYAALATFWITFEYIHLNWELTWPWLTLGNGFAEYPSLVQWYEFTGVFGGGLWIWLANIWLLEMWNNRQQFRPQGSLVWKTTALLLIPMMVSLAMYYTYVPPAGETAEVVVVQPNYEPHYQKFSVPKATQVDQFIQLSLPVLDAEVDYLVFPETAYGFVKERNVVANRYTQRLRQAFAEFPNLQLVTGLNAYHDFLPDEPRTAATRTRERGSQTIDFETMNLAAQIPIRPTDTVQTYRKSKLVPGPEILPYKKIFFFMEPLIESLDGTTAGLGVQDKRSVFSSEAGRIGPAICYESVFGEYYAGYVRDGKAQAIFIMTNDGWWDNTAGHRQHLYYASLRAIETRRAIARSANTGISGFINQRGDILQATNYEEPAVVRGTLQLNDEWTFYTRWGDLIARFASFVAILLLLNAFVKGRLQKEKS
ncbi:MAG: apolipoprotein N-acyltransferase [Bacteroidota bacterium]